MNLAGARTITADAAVRARLSWTWVFVLLNMVFADIFSFMNADFLRQIMDGRVDQVDITPGFLLAAAVVTAIPIAMVVLSQVLPSRANRWANIVVGIGTIAYVWVAGALTLPHYIFFATLETAGSFYIVAYAWKRRDAMAPTEVQS